MAFRTVLTRQLPQDELALVIRSVYAYNTLQYHVQLARNRECRALVVFEVLCPSGTVTQGQMIILIDSDPTTSPG